MGPTMRGALMMAVAMATCADPMMRNSSRSSYEPNIPEEKKILPGIFKGIIPKGCKIETIPIGIKHDGYHLTQYVDIVFGSEKAKQKAIIKAEYQIKDYLKQRIGSRDPQFSEFDQVEIYHL